jgi:hypothetical protein
LNTYITKMYGTINIKFSKDTVSVDIKEYQRAVECKTNIGYILLTGGV